MSDGVSLIADIWPGWTIRRHNEGLRKHVELSGRDAAPFEIDEDEAIRRIVALLSENNSFDPWDALRSIVGDGSKAGVQVGHGFFEVDRPAFDPAAKAGVLRQSIAAYREGVKLNRQSQANEMGPSDRSQES